jgi:nucleotide-binding universal stress UspA family protein
MYKHVLIPVQLDDSRDVPTAQEVAKLLCDDGGRISFLHVIEPIPAMAEAYVPDDQAFERRDFAKARIEEIAAAIPGAHAALTDGGAGRSITDWADDNGVDCIVIASHQPTLSDVFLGSTAAWVVRHAKCPVHVVR